MHHPSLRLPFMPALVLTLIVGASAQSAPRPRRPRLGERLAARIRRPASPAARSGGKPPTRAPRLGASVATLTTNQGAIVIKLDAAKAPCTVNSFVYLAERKYLDVKSVIRSVNVHLASLHTRRCHG